MEVTDPEVKGAKAHLIVAFYEMLGTAILLNAIVTISHHGNNIAGISTNLFVAA